jgi:hypothetical protein
MKHSDIAELVNQRPFRPFALETMGGTRIEVARESDVLMSPRRPDIVVVCDSDGHLHILSVDEIAVLLP